MNATTRTILILATMISCAIAIRSADAHEKRYLGVVIYTVVALLISFCALSALRNGRIVFRACGVGGVIERAKSPAYFWISLSLFFASATFLLVIAGRRFL